MRTSHYLLYTLKEDPVGAEIISHKLMLRSGMIRKLASGLYIWLPTGLRVLYKIINIVREEMNNIGAIEICMPMIQPLHLWEKSGRKNQYGNELLYLIDRTSKSFILGPTHEEIITNFVHNEINSYKELPLIFYQIQNKFRDEIRPRFGVIRSREFIMKDAYSFHSSYTSLKDMYNVLYQTYNIIFTRIGLNFCIVEANTGSIGGCFSHEFHALSNTGEDEIVFSTKSNYAVNIDLAKTLIPKIFFPSPQEDLRLISVPYINTIDELIKKFKLPIEKTVKIFIVHSYGKNNSSLVALMLRGDHQINKIKVEKLPYIVSPLIFASKEEIYKTIGVNFNFLGPINLSLPLVIDYSVALMSDFISGANINNKYYFGINWERDLPLPDVADLRKVVNGDISPDGKGSLLIKRGIEIGHIFQLGTKYSKIMKATVHEKDSSNIELIMGCYGIGITRIIAAYIEQNYDKNGILWSDYLAPFTVAIIPINMHKSFLIKNITEKIYRELQKHDIEVLLDDRQEYIGNIFSDIELLGIPHILIIGKQYLNKQEIEYKNRRTGVKQSIKACSIISFLLNKIKYVKKCL